MSRQKKIPVDRVNQRRLDSHARGRYVYTGPQIINRSGKPVLVDSEDGKKSLGGRRFMRNRLGMNGTQLRAEMRRREREANL